MNENKSIDARTFQEIWETLTDYQRTNLKWAIQMNLEVSDQAIRFWRTGKRHPCKANRKEIARLTSIVTKTRCKPELLFPKV
jgi:hypothetical protein